MTAQRSRKEEKQYRQHRKKHVQKVCPFCDINPDEIVRTTKYFYVLRNIFPYSLWDGQEVSDHLMVVPKRHTDKLGGTTPEEAVAFLKIIDSYEAKGYNLYARSPSSSIKSVVHQHTHLMKPKGKQKRFLLMVRKPFIRIAL